MSEACWRIDELAQQAGLTVDTIRYYAREGLLPPPDQAGPPPALRPRAPRAARPDPRAPGASASRSPRSGPSSTPTARASKASSPPAAASYSLAELIERSGARRASSSTGCATSGCSPTRPSSAATTYDDTDLALLRAVAELRAIGMTPEILRRARPHLRRPLRRAAARRARHALRQATTRRGTPTSSSRSSSSSPRTRSA